MLKLEIETAILKQIEKEIYSSNLYLSMASWTHSHGYAGTSKWLYAQSDEERLHALKLINYLNDRGGHATITATMAPPVNFESVQQVFEQVLEHELVISESINNIVGICLEAKDYPTQNWLQWFVNEQIQEEASVSAILDKLKLLGGQNMYLFDRDVFALRQTAATNGNTTP